MTEPEKAAPSAAVSPSLAYSPEDLAQNIQAMIAAASAAAMGTEALNARALDFAKRRAQAIMRFNDKASRTSSFSQALELQGAFAKETADMWTSELKTCSDLLMDVSKQWAKPLQERLAEATWRLPV